jgi:uncharacterized protein (TIGR02453 family)
MDLRIVLSFLKDLENNNNREWMNENKVRYLEAKATFELLVQKLIDLLSETIPELIRTSPKECIFRLHRDIRFSKDKTPYKTNFGADIKKGGRKSPAASFYLHIQPGESFLAGGIYMPSPKMLAAIRQEIDYQSEDFRKILNQPVFKARFGPLQGEQLKRAPKGYQPDDPNIDLLRHKSFISIHKIPDKKLIKDDFPDYLIDTFEIIKPFNQFLDRVLET